MKACSRIVAFLCFAFATAAIAEPPPISAFARLEEIKSPVLSPDGRYLAYIGRSKGERLAIVMDLKDQSTGPKAVLLTDKKNEFEMTWCRWAKTARLLCGFEQPFKIQTHTFRGSRMVAVNADGSDIKVLMQNSQKAFSYDQDTVLDLLPNTPDTVLVTSFENKSDVMMAPSQFPSVFELNIFTGAMRKYSGEYAPIRNFLSDQRGNIRLGSGIEGTKSVYFARLEGEKAWRQLAKVEAYEATDAYVPQAIIPGTNKAYAIGPQNGRKALWIIDLEDKEKPQLVFDHPLVDVTTPVRTSDGALIGVFYEVDKPFIYYTDERVSALMAAVKKILPNTFNVVRSVARDRSSMIISASSDTDAGTYYLFEVATAKLVRLGKAYPELNPDDLPRMQTIEYKASDGTLIPGYLTVPTNKRAEKLPLIVMPHGGPIARDTWRFDFLRHFLASRGYAVLQMNFRGSSGYGGKWFLDAFQDWGGLTYSDIADGAKWSIAQGIADPQRVCILGWSFGGYAALVGATRNPDLFKCSVSIAGLSDLEALRSNALALNSKIMQKQIGADKAKLRANSPLEHIADVNMPVLLIHGTMDAQAPYEQSKSMANALTKAKKNVRFVTIENGDHGLYREAERTLLLTEIEQFLKANLGPGVTTAARD